MEAEVFAGPLRKRSVSPRVMARWKQRYVRLLPTALAISRSAGARRYKLFPLAEGDSRVDVVPDRAFTMVVKTGGHEVQLQAASDAELTEWLSALRRVLKAPVSPSPSAASAASPTPSSPTPAPPTPPAASPASPAVQSASPAAQPASPPAAAATPGPAPAGGDDERRWSVSSEPEESEARAQTAELEECATSLHDLASGASELRGELEAAGALRGVADGSGAEEACTVQITVIAADGLPALDSFTRKADPFVRVGLLPAATAERVEPALPLRTSTKWKSLHPLWDESFSLRVPLLPGVSHHPLTAAACDEAAALVLEVWSGEVQVGRSVVALAALADVEAQECWHQLLSPDGVGAVGRLHLRTRLDDDVPVLRHALRQLLLAKRATLGRAMELEDRLGLDGITPTKRFLLLEAEQQWQSVEALLSQLLNLAGRPELHVESCARVLEDVEARCSVLSPPHAAAAADVRRRLAAARPHLAHLDELAAEPERRLHVVRTPAMLDGLRLCVGLSAAQEAALAETRRRWAGAQMVLNELRRQFLRKLSADAPSLLEVLALQCEGVEEATDPLLPPAPAAGGARFRSGSDAPPMPQAPRARADSAAARLRRAATPTRLRDAARSLLRGSGGSRDAQPQQPQQQRGATRSRGRARSLQQQAEDDALQRASWADVAAGVRQRWGRVREALDSLGALVPVPPDGPDGTPEPPPPLDLARTERLLRYVQANVEDVKALPRRDVGVVRAVRARWRELRQLEPALAAAAAAPRVHASHTPALLQRVDAEVTGLSPAAQADLQRLRERWSRVDAQLHAVTQQHLDGKFDAGQTPAMLRALAEECEGVSAEAIASSPPAAPTRRTGRRARPQRPGMPGAPPRVIAAARVGVSGSPSWRSGGSRTASPRVSAPTGGGASASPASPSASPASPSASASPSEEFPMRDRPSIVFDEGLGDFRPVG